MSRVCLWQRTTVGLKGLKMRKNLESYKKLFEEELFERCVPFWLQNGPDRECGGLLHCLDREGKLFSTDKGVWMQGRCGWMFANLYNELEPRPEYLKLSAESIAFARKHCFAPDGRMYQTVTREGLPVESCTQWFSETFYLSANAELYLATKESSYLEEAKRVYDFVWQMYQDPATDPRKGPGFGKGFARQTKAFAEPMILLNVTGILRAADTDREHYYNENADRLFEDIRAFHSDEYHGTLEQISTDNRIILEAATCRVCNPGHDMECAWFLLEEGIYRGKEEMIRFAQTMFDDAYEMGLDREYGGILYNRDITGAPVEAYEQDMKIWWVHNEAIIASLMLYQHTGKEKYRTIFEEMTEYSFSHFSDPEFGEWCASLRREGAPNEPSMKGFLYKGPFHVMRMLVKCIKLLTKD